MLARNLLFIGVILTGLTSLTAALFPPSLPKRAAHFQLAEFDNDSVRACVN